MKEKEIRVKTYSETLPINDDSIVVNVKITFPEGGGTDVESAIAKVKRHMKKAVADLSHLDQVEIPLPGKK